MLNLPFALVGGVLAIAAIGMPLSVSAAVAFIVLLGIAVQNGVVLIAFFRQLRAEGRSVAETVRDGCDLRFRPLIMTALCSFIGHVPMLYATGSGADIQKPLAVVVMGGLVTSTLLTLIVLPTIYEWLESRKKATAGGGRTMKQVIAFIKPHQLSPVAMGLRDIPGLTGLSIGKGQASGAGAPGAPPAASSRTRWRTSRTCASRSSAATRDSTR